MRVSDSMYFTVAQQGIRRAQEQNLSAIERASTGKRVGKPSDDPAASARAREQENLAERADGFARSAARAIDGLALADEVMNEMGGLVSRASELAVQGANAVTSAQDRLSIAQEVEHLRDQLLKLANTQHEGRYLFGGREVATPPFDAAGSFVGDAAILEVPVGRGLRLDASVSGQDLLAPAGGLDVFASLDALEVALNSDDTAAIREGVADMQAAVGQIAQGRSSGGVAQRGLVLARNAAERSRDAAEQRVEELTAIDVYQAFSDMVRAEQVLQQATAIASRLPPSPGVGG